MGGDRKYANLVEIYDGARVRDADPPSTRLPGARGERSVDRGDLAPDHPAGRAPQGRSGMKPKPPVPKWRWATWYAALGAALVLFYGLFTPFWFGVRALAGRPSSGRGGGGDRFRGLLANRYVYDFDEAGRRRPRSPGRVRELALAEMTLMGVPVPAGFTITTDASAGCDGGGRGAAGRARAGDRRARSPARGAGRQAVRLERRSAACLGGAPARRSRCPG